MHPAAFLPSIQSARQCSTTHVENEPPITKGRNGTPPCHRTIHEPRPIRWVQAIALTGNAPVEGPTQSTREVHLAVAPHDAASRNRQVAITYVDELIRYCEPGRSYLRMPSFEMTVL